MEWEDTSVLEAASWRLASELVRRHPGRLRLIRAQWGSGHDVLWLLPRLEGPGDVRLNRTGSIRVLQPFEKAAASESSWHRSWDDYLRADPRRFLADLEAASGLPAPPGVPGATSTTLTLRVLASIAATAVKSVDTIDIQPGFIDANDGGAPNSVLEAFSAIPPKLLRARGDDFHGQPGYRFWVVVRGSTPLLAVDQHEATAWTTQREHGLDLMRLYHDSGRRLLVTTLELFRWAENLTP